MKGLPQRLAPGPRGEQKFPRLEVTGRLRFLVFVVDKTTWTGTWKVRRPRAADTVVRRRT